MRHWQTMTLATVAPCQHEQADTRICVHVRHAAEQGCKSVIVNACNTDVLVIAVSVLPLLQNAGLPTAVGSPWSGSRHKVDTYIWPSYMSWVWQMQKTVRLSCFLLLWCPCLPWHRQDIRMANLGCLCWGYWRFFSAQPISINLERWHLRNHIAVCSIDVWQQGTHLLMLMKQGSICLPESKDHIKP